MRLLLEALAYIADGAHWSGSMGIARLLAQHAAYSLAAVAIAALIGMPIGWWIGHTGHGRALVITLTGAVRALPTLGLITMFGLALGIGLAAPMLALVILALPSALAGAYSGVESVDPTAVDGARGAGMSPLQILARVEMPLGAPIMLGGLRAASLQVIATGTLAAYTGAGGLGRLMFLGLKTQDYPIMLAAALLVIALALVSEALFALLQRASAPAGSRQRREEAS